ncbi:MAG: hypothetical protein ABI577_04505 [bacterium]
MRLATRLSLLSLLAAALLTTILVSAQVTRAASPFTVTVSVAQESVPVGGNAVFRIKVEGQTAQLPSFNYDVEGGSLAGIASLDPTAANVAEGSVFVTRESSGMATLSVRLGSEVLASGTAKFASMGTLSLTVTLNAGLDAAARTWRYEVLSTSGSLVATLSASTSGDAPTTIVAVPNLPYGFYTVRQILGNDTRTACSAGVFYKVASPVSAETTLELASASASVVFTITPCADLPTLEVSVPIDTIAPGSGTVGEADVLPGETPVSEVRGTRQAGPGEPLPPSVGNSPRVDPNASKVSLLLLLAGTLASLAPVFAWSVARVRSERLK